MAINLDADVGELFKSLVSGLRSPKGEKTTRRPGREKGRRSLKPYRTVIVLALCMGASVTAFIGAYALPEYQKNIALAKKVYELRGKKEQLPSITSQIATFRGQLDTGTAQYKGLLDAFDDTADIEDLYNAISSLAVVNMLTIQNMQKGSSMKHPTLKAVDQTFVDIQLSGRFHDYVKFKEQLAADRPLLAIQTETMSAPKDSEGTLNFTLKLTTYTIDKSPYHAFLKEPVYGPQKEMADVGK